MSRKQNKGYTKFRPIRTNSRGKYRTTLPRRGGTWYYSISVKGDAQYLANGYVWRTWRI